jgi:hypothetical protein
MLEPAHRTDGCEQFFYLALVVHAPIFKLNALLS